LERIGVPTLVVHGARDRMIPVANARITAQRVPGARLRILKDAGHLYPTEEPGVDEAIGEFFAAYG
jgi:pimeloyl-ACP methyl ester carboxylesterase